MREAWVGSGRVGSGRVGSGRVGSGKSQTSLGFSLCLAPFIISL